MQSPQSLDRYEVIRELGRGGMATVYLAHDPRFKRDVAIKILPREFLHDPMFQARFEREAQTIASLEHSSIVPVYDFGEYQGQPYLVMRYMAGGSLLDRIRRGRLSLDESVRVMQRVAAALDTAHSKGIIHRDLKPANILFDNHDDAYLSDFGVVKLTEATSSLTASGKIIGTPHYMAPELADVGEVTPAVDIYALGITLYQMLTASVPYEADTPLRIMVAHLNEPIPDLRDKRPDLPEEVNQVVRQALAKDPAARYESAGMLAADLARAAGGEQPLARTLVDRPTPQANQFGVTVDIPTKPEQVEHMQPDTDSRKGLPGWVWAVVGMGVMGLIVVLGLIWLAPRLIDSGSNEASVPTAAVEPTVEVIIVSNTPEPTLEPTQAPEDTIAPEPSATLPPGPTLEPVEVKPYCEFENDSPTFVASGQPVTLVWKWTALTAEQVQDHIEAGIYTIMLDGEVIEAQRQGDIVYDSEAGTYSVSWYADVGVLSDGEHYALRRLSWRRQIFDGWDTYGPGGDIENEADGCTIIVH